MDKKLCIVFVAIIAVAHGAQQQAQTNYDLSRNRLGSGGGGYGQYNPDYPHYQNPGSGLYPSGPGSPGQYPGSGYPGQYPGSGYPGYQKPGLPGPPGAHAGCPLCDSSVYGYCSYKEAHDACCCENNAYNYNCRKADCKYLYANSCQEYNLISSCCCIDVKSAAVPAVAVVG